MIVFGSELRYHPKLEHVKLGLFKPIAKLYLQMFGIFGMFDPGAFLRSVYFRKMLKKYKFEFDSVLDAGCGHGHYSFYLARKYPNVIIDSVDIDEDIIDENKYIQNQLKTVNINFFQCDLLKLSEYNKYDFAYSIDVLEHIKDDEKVIENICNALKKRGYLLIHTPQKSRKKYLGHSWKEIFPDHVREGYTIDEISQLLERTGFDIIEKINTLGFFGEITYGVHLLLSGKGILQRIFVIPINCLAYLDAIIHHKKGSGLLIVAKKMRD